MTRIVLILFLSISIHAQNLDSLYNVLVNSNTKSRSELAQAQFKPLTTDKCTFGLLATIKENFSHFSKQQQEIISDIMARPELSTSIISPSGFFRIHYDETGSNAPVCV